MRRVASTTRWPGEDPSEEAARATISAVAYLPALLVAGAALFVLVVMLLALIGPIRRFRAALRDYRAGVDAETSALHAGREQVRRQLDHLRPSRSDRDGG